MYNNKTEAIAWKHSFTFVLPLNDSPSSHMCVVLYIHEKLGDHISMTVVWCAAVATVLLLLLFGSCACVSYLFLLSSHQKKNIHNSWCIHNWMLSKTLVFSLFFIFGIRPVSVYVSNLSLYMRALIFIIHTKWFSPLFEISLFDLVCVCVSVHWKCDSQNYSVSVCVCVCSSWAHNFHSNLMTVVIYVTCTLNWL